MSVIGDLYFNAYEQLEAEFGRTPTDKEVEDKVASMLGNRIDNVHDSMKGNKPFMRIKFSEHEDCDCMECRPWTS